jgi:putative PIN family toxin of toxin-antitoxin system
MLHTEATFNEFVVTLNKLKFDKQFAKRELTREGIIERWRQFSTLVSPSDVPANVVADPNDIIFLAAAAGGDADAIITGDDHLLRLITFRYSQMLTPAQFLDLINLPAEPPADAPQID